MLQFTSKGKKGDGKPFSKKGNKITNEDIKQHLASQLGIDPDKIKISNK